MTQLYPPQVSTYTVVSPFDLITITCGTADHMLVTWVSPAGVTGRQVIRENHVMDLGPWPVQTVVTMTPRLGTPSFDLKAVSVGGGAPSTYGTIPVNSVLATIGDSITANAYQQNNAQDRVYSTTGYVYFGLEGISHRLRVPYNGNLAVVGNTLSQILTSLGTNAATLAALSGKIVTGNGGTNDITSQTLAAMQATENSIRSAVLGTHAVYVRVGVTPLWGVAALSGANETKRLAFNAFLKTTAASYPGRMFYVDVDALGLTAADFNTDGTHPVFGGAQKIGAAWAAVVAPLLANGNIVDSLPVETYTLNNVMAGGTTVATSWTSTTSGLGGATATYSKDVNDRQRILVGGAATGTGRTCTLDQYSTVAAVGLTPAAGSQFEAVVEYEIVGQPTGIGAIGILFGVGTSGFANLAQGQNVGNDNANSASPNAAGVYRSRTIGVVMGSGAPNFMTTRVILAFIDGVAPSLDIRINKIEFRKVA